MLALLCTLTNLEEVACTATTAQQNRFVPGPVLYRTALAGAMLHAKLFSDGENYAEYYNALLNTRPDAETVRKAYRRLLGRLPSVAVTDAVLCTESQVRREVFNVLYDGTATALGSLKNAPVRAELPQSRLVRRRDGSVALREAAPLRTPTGLSALDFTMLRADPKQGYPLPSIREVMTARIGEQAHLFRTPGAVWQMTLLAQDESQLQDAEVLLRVALQDLGMGAKHSFRGKGLITERHLAELRPIEQATNGFLFQPLICRDSDIMGTLQRLGLEMTLNIDLTMRTADFGPQAKVVPAVSGEILAHRGYMLERDGRHLIFTEEDFHWPRPIGIGSSA